VAELGVILNVHHNGLEIFTQAALDAHRGKRHSGPVLQAGGLQYTTLQPQLLDSYLQTGGLQYTTRQPRLLDSYL